MKRKLFAAAAAFIAAGSLFGCGKELSNKYVTVSQYKGLEVAKVEAEEVTDDSVENTIQSSLAATAEKVAVTDRTAQDGDWVNLDYTGSVDGVEFDGGSAQGADLQLGSGTFIGASDDYAGFEDQIIGHGTGEEFDITVQFPDPYSYNTALSGAVTNFHVLLNEIYTQVTPELTDEWVQENSEESETVEEYREEIHALLEEQAEESKQAQLESEVQSALLDKIEVKEYPEDVVEAQIADMKEYYEQIAGYYGMELGEFTETYLQTSEEDFEAKLTEEARQTAAFDEAVKLIAEKEKLDLTEEEYEEKIAEYARQNGAQDVESYKEEVGEEVLKKAILRDKVTDYLVDNCVQVEESSDSE